MVIVVLGLTALWLVGSVLGGAATITGNAWRKLQLDPREAKRQALIRDYRAKHPNEPVYTPWHDD